VVSPVMLIAGAGRREARPASVRWTRARLCFRLFSQLGSARAARHGRGGVSPSRVIAAVCRASPGKAKAAADRVPSPDYIARCRRHLNREVDSCARAGHPAVCHWLSHSFSRTPSPLAQGRLPTGSARWPASSFDVIRCPHPSVSLSWHPHGSRQTLLGAGAQRDRGALGWRSLSDGRTVIERQRSLPTYPAHSGSLDPGVPGRKPTCHDVAPMMVADLTAGSSLFPTQPPAPSAAPSTIVRCASTSPRCCARPAPTSRRRGRDAHDGGPAPTFARLGQLRAG